MGQTGTVMIPLRLEKDLSFMLEAAEGFGVGYPVNIPLVAGAQLAGGKLVFSAAGVDAQRCMGG